MRELKSKQTVQVLTQSEVERVSGGFSPFYLRPIPDIDLGDIVGAPNPQPWPPIDIVPGPINQLYGF